MPNALSLFPALFGKSTSASPAQPPSGATPIAAPLPSSPAAKAYLGDRLALSSTAQARRAQMEAALSDIRQQAQALGAGVAAPPSGSVAPTPAPAPQAAAHPSLEKGATGDDVKLLQAKLTAAGCDPGGVDGIFGPQTQSAVEDYQYTRGLDTDGIVGPITWNALDTNAPAVKQMPGNLENGATGDDVKLLQAKLAAAGCDPGDVDGIFGPQTQSAVEDYQYTRGLDTDGIVGPITWNALVTNAPAVKQKPADDPAYEARLEANLDNSEKGVVHECFAYAWAVVRGAGGKGLDDAERSTAGRGESINALTDLENSGQVRVGDVIYVNTQPGADPSSTNMDYEPHWFVYLGGGKLADQYGVKPDAAAMQDFVQGRVIDTIFHTA